MGNVVKLPSVAPGTMPVISARSSFADFEGKSEVPSKTMTNALIALHKLDLNCWHDLFTNKKYVGGMELNSEVGGQLTDDSVAYIRSEIRREFKFDPGKDNTWDAINLLCRQRAVHPVKDYLEACAEKWEPWYGSKIDTMLIDYFKAPDTPFVRAVSRIVMVASCRRIYEPGCKFDYMTVLESPEGKNKSSALAMLYGAQWFSDQAILDLKDKELAENVRGRWCMECAELSGMKKADVEKIKAQLSRSADRTRPAYGRAVIDAPRSCIFWGTTNDHKYLRSQTGNRRFFPIEIGRIDIEGLKRDRDLFWGEAMHAHRAGESIMLPEALWADAGAEQDKRTMSDPWGEMVECISELASDYQAFRDKHGPGDDDESKRLGTVYSNDNRTERVTSQYLLSKVIGISPAQQTAEHGKRLALVMRKDRWEGPETLWIGGRAVKGYERPATREPEPWEV
jgi:predicted P-loop ATPase